jgi:hypothetical protein
VVERHIRFDGRFTYMADKGGKDIVVSIAWRLLAGDARLLVISEDIFVLVKNASGVNFIGSLYAVPWLIYSYLLSGFEEPRRVALLPALDLNRSEIYQIGNFFARQKQALYQVIGQGGLQNIRFNRPSQK